MDMNQYLEIFIEETKEHLQSMNQALLQMEKHPGDKAMLNEIFRVAHTLKGMAGTMGFSKLAKLTHEMENVLHALRSGEMDITPDLVDILFECLDILEKYLNTIISTGGEGNEEFSGMLRTLNEIKSARTPAAEPSAGTPAVEVEKAVAEESRTASFQINQYEQNAINKATEMGMNAFKITVFLNKGCVLKSARAFIIFQALERHSEIIKSVPKVEDIEDEKFDFEFTVVVVSREDSVIFDRELNSIAEVERAEIISLNAEALKEASARGETLGGVKPGLERGDEAGPESIQESEGVKVLTTSRPKTGKTVRVDIDRLDVLMNLVSELIISKTKLAGLDDIVRSQKFTEEVEYLERITTNLHDAVMKVRMVPVETVFNRFPRMIRDTAKELGKAINLHMSGEETELDRTVIDEIGEPLIHLLRNSADHGIESADTRKKAGKPETGNIYLRAYQSGNNVIIEVEDDGKGIDLEKTKRKAIEKGLINSQVAENLSKKDIISFLFRPSFSTADKVTDLSGRGVGLDVVKTKIEALGGVIDVETEYGKGTKTVIRLPLTLAIIQALLVYIGEEKYAIPLSNVHKIEYISPGDVKFVQQQEVILFRNTVVPIIRLGEVLEVRREEGKKPKQLTVVIIKKGDRLSGFIVDSLIGQQEIVIKSLGKLLMNIKVIAGATILGDGNVALILDVNSLA